MEAIEKSACRPGCKCEDCELDQLAENESKRSFEIARDAKAMAAAIMAIPDNDWPDWQFRIKTMAYKMLKK